MPWFLYREEAEALMAQIPRKPDWTYEILPNGCGPGWGIMVHDADGHLITEAYSNEEGLAAAAAEHKRRMKEDERLGKEVIERREGKKIW